MMNTSTLIILASIVKVFCSILGVFCYSFRINYNDDSFYMEGKPFRYISGSLHYFRIPNEYWRDRLRKTRAAGLNAISTYVEWSQHEPQPGVFYFKKDLNIKKFIKIAQEENLYVILRPGPYVNAERDFGGLPFWLLTNNTAINLRTMDENYTYYIERWLDMLMLEVSSYLYGRGGPIILIQVEDEYASSNLCDRQYMQWLRNIFRKHVAGNAVLFTTDKASKKRLDCGKIPGVYSTVSFDPHENMIRAFEVQRSYEHRGPIVNSAYYTSRCTHWGEKMRKTFSTDAFITGLREMLDLGANVNIYMFAGGTNFGFKAGASYNGVYKSFITSFDYDAPISEAGDLTDKYFAIKNLTAKYIEKKSNTHVETSSKGEFGEYELEAVANLLSPTVKNLLGRTYKTRLPVAFEAVFQDSGYVIYETTVRIDMALSMLQIPILHDIGHVYLNSEYQGTISRESPMYDLYLPLKKGDILSILVENLGRINFGPKLKDSKGILSEVSFSGIKVESWNITSFKFDDLNLINKCIFINGSKNECLTGKGFTFYWTSFKIPFYKNYRKAQILLDTFLDVSHLTKGIVFLNKHNLGRYWSIRGPQCTLYVPGIYLRSFPKQNSLIIIEEKISSKTIKVKFIKNHILCSKEEAYR